MRDFIDTRYATTECQKLLVYMTNLYIEYRNQCWDGVINQNTGEIPDMDDKLWLDEIDAEIDAVEVYFE